MAEIETASHWEQVEPTGPHLTYLLISAFLISYVLFTNFIRNRLHLSEPPIALLLGIILGPAVLGWLQPNTCGVDGCLNPDGPEGGLGGWGWGDDIVQEATRVIVGIQVFAIGVELPRHYASRHWRSVLMLLGPVMAFGWVICALFVGLIFKTDIPTALTIAACLTPTDPVLAASILSNSQFSSRLPRRLKNMLSAESGCNDGISFPFLYIGLYLLTQATAGEVAKEWFLITILWQCTFGSVIGFIVGRVFNMVLRFSEKRKYVDEAGFVVFYLLLALLSVGIGSTLGADDFLVAFSAGYGFARDGWFSKKTAEADLPKVIDLLLNSSMFVYFGTIIPWYEYTHSEFIPTLTPLRLVLFLVLVLLFRRIPAVLLTWKFIPDIHTIYEAWFCGHFGPMGLGGLFLAIEARAILENGKAIPDPRPPIYDGLPSLTDRQRATALIWPIVSFVTFGSTFVHGLSVLALTIANHFMRSPDNRASILAGEEDPLEGMQHEDEYGSSELDESDDEHQRVQDEIERDQESPEEGDLHGVHNNGPNRKRTRYGTFAPHRS